ncbi:MAG: FAD-binding oxidoreductase [Gammaproteobacteria bacterium]|nr:FAD-binding oxidoreductase [Gammaproteobacteria bacterium]
MPATTIDTETLDRLKTVVGPSGFIDDVAEMEGYLRDERRFYRGKTPLVLRPSSTGEVSSIVRICAEAGIAIVPQGGNTGLCGGSVPDESGSQILLSLSRMRKIREVDAVNYTLTAEAGCVLADIQAAAREAGRLFPLSLAAEGSCQIGGNLSTNAGGTQVLRYGNAKELVLGLEVVLPNGEVWNGLRRLRKDNTGYDLKQLFLGSEGTLGIITAAVLKLFPLPKESCTALLAARDPAAATALLSRLRDASGDVVTSYEYIHRQCLDLVFRHMQGFVDPFDHRYEHYVLAELSASRSGAGLDEVLESVCGEALESGEVLDAVVSTSEAQRQQLWGLREAIPEAQKHAGVCIKHDVSVSVSRVPEFLEKGTRLLNDAMPEAPVIAFGHMGDGNVHFNLQQAEGDDPEEFLSHAPRITKMIHDLAAELEGSFSAEHGIGKLKRDDLYGYKSEVELELMRALKGALDPMGIMNPGKVI